MDVETVNTVNGEGNIPENGSAEEKTSNVVTTSEDEGFKKPLLPTFKPNQSKTTKPNDENVQVKKAEQEKVEFPYEPPPWKGQPDDRYYIEELKNGTIVRTIELSDKPFVKIGRVESCDIDMAHPTVSRFHAVLLHRSVPDEQNEKGYYIYDLGSTHGTFLNKYRIKPRVYVRIKVGHMIKFGASSRLFCFLGPDEDQEEESELSMTELKAKRKALIEERKQEEEKEKMLQEMEKERQERMLEERGISWGMAEDADEETDLSENPYAVLTNEELYIDDPRKALRLWYEREGYELEYQMDRAEKGMFVCKLVLPVDDEFGQEIAVEASARNKRECQVQCALDACRAIDKLGLLKPSKQESKKVKKRNWEENDYYDSDEDSFFDRTGDLDRKRKKRMNAAGKTNETVETYDSLMVKHEATLKKIKMGEKKLNELSNSTSEEKPISEDIDALDAYMLSLNNSKSNKKIDIKIAKEELQSLKDEEVRLRKLINIAKPTNMPELLQPVMKNISEPSAPSAPSESSHKETNVVPEKKAQVESKPEKKVIGPTLPPNLTIVNDKIVPKKKKTKTEDKIVEDEQDVVWVPPKGQTGDGKTHLNDKYGY